jgi:hypothetical protein
MDSSRRLAVITGHLLVNETKNKVSKCPVANEGKAWPRFKDPNPVRVVVTGAAGNIAYR